MPASTLWLFSGQGSQGPVLPDEVPELVTFVEGAASRHGLDTWGALRGGADVTSDELQPALFVFGAGLASAAIARGARPDCVVGHSLGEYAALVAAGSLSFEDGLDVVVERGRATRHVEQAHGGGMTAILGLEEAQVRDVCEPLEDVWIANLNGPRQVVIAGTEYGLAVAGRSLRLAGAFRVQRLSVPAPCHTPLMSAVASATEQALARVTVRPPTCGFLSAHDASPHSDPEDIRRHLVEALTAPVRFGAVLRTAAGMGVSAAAEVAPKAVLRSTIARALPQAQVVSVRTVAELVGVRAAVPEDRSLARSRP